MSIEQQKRRAMRRVMFWRLLCLPVKLTVKILGALMVVADDLHTLIFYAELDAARDFRLLSGYDLGVAAGDWNRYMGMTEDSYLAAEQRFEDA